jgi:hypothetical protein
MNAEAGEDFALGGVGAHADGLDARLLVLPVDPEAPSVPLDNDMLAWLTDPHVDIENGPRLERRHSSRAVTDALVAYDDYREDGRLGSYRAIHRHGGLEAGATGIVYTQRETRVFPLRSLVGLVWTTAALQLQACERWSIQGPFELSLALRDTAGAALGEFAEGWLDFDSGLHDPSRCLDQRVLLCTELDHPVDPRALAFEMGDRLELAFGTVHRRYVANRGPFEGQFDPR